MVCSYLYSAFKPTFPACAFNKNRKKMELSAGLKEMRVECSYNSSLWIITYILVQER